MAELSQAAPIATATELRRRADALRAAILRVYARVGYVHLGGSLSMVEILTALLYGPLATENWGKDPLEGDRLVLSKGHAALALYCALAEKGIITAEQINSFGTEGTALEPHPNERLVSSIHASTGSLGQGLSIGLGLAYGSRMANRCGERVVVILGDGELNEGQVWEAAQAAYALNLGSLVAVIDANGLQQDGPMTKIMPIKDIASAFASFGWRVEEVDGHDVDRLAVLFGDLFPARDLDAEGTPALVLAHTVKGRGVPHLENETESHYPPPLSAGDLALITLMASKEGVL